MKLKKYINFSNGKKRPKESGNIPIYGGNGILGYTNKNNTDKNNIIIGRVGAYCGCVYKCDDECWISDNAILGKVKEGTDYNFLYYLLRSIDLHRLHIGAAHPLMTQDILNEVEVDIPNYIQQKKIAKILENIDKKIELNNKINDNLYEIGKTYYQNWAESCIEEIAIKEVAEEILDYTKNLNKTVKLINSSDVTNGKFIRFDFVENNDLKGHFKKNFKKYDILYSQIRPRNHHYGYVLFNDTSNYLASTRLMIIRNKKDKISSSLLYFSVISNEAIEDFTAKTESRSGTFPQGNYEDLSSFKIKYKKEQNEITKLLDSILEKIYLNQNETEKLESLRDMLLPKLINGEIDLDKIEI